MKKQFSRIFSLFLAVVLMAGLLCVQASAAGTEITNGSGSYKVAVSDVVSEQKVIFTLMGYPEEISLYELAAGTTFTGSATHSEHLEFSLYPAKLVGNTLEVSFDGAIYYDADVWDPTSPVTMTANDSGFWLVLMTDISSPVLQFGINVTGESAPVEPEQPVEPTTPVEPEQPVEPVTPVEPETPAEPEQPTEPTTPVETETPVVPDEPGAYTVKKGDTWSSICTNFYGNNAQRYNLMKANKGVKLAAGAVVTLPEKLDKAVLIAAPVAGEGETLYTVKAGDTLGTIAQAAYGDVMQYKAIFERNSDRLANANTIYEGQVIVLPAK